MKRRFQNRPEKGNALFLILIAVALFAALAYAVTQSGRSGGGATSREKNALLAAQIVSAGNALAQAVQRVILAGAAPNSIIYDVSGTNNCPGYVSPFCTTGSSCVFSGAGGGAPPLPQPAAAFAPPGGTSALVRVMGEDVGGACAGLTGVAGVGTVTSDTVLLYEGLSQGVCQAINAGLGISGIPALGSWGNMNGAPGQYNACVEFVSWNPGYYVYYQVLVAH
jgi:hypothetical protein